MVNALFGTRCWSWTLLHSGVSRQQILRLSPLLPYITISPFLPYPTAPHFYSRLLQCNITALYLLDSMLYYVQSKTLFEYNKTYAPIYLPSIQIMMRPTDDAFI